MKNILIPVDFSGFSECAVKTGAHIARKTGAMVHLLNVTSAPDDWQIMSTEE